MAKQASPRKQKHACHFRNKSGDSGGLLKTKHATLNAVPGARIDSAGVRAKAGKSTQPQPQPHLHPPISSFYALTISMPTLLHFF